MPAAYLFAIRASGLVETRFLVASVATSLQHISHVYHVHLSRLQAFLGIYHRLFGDLFLPWPLEDKMDHVAGEQSKQGDLGCHTEDTDHEADIEAQCRNKTNKRCNYQDR